MKTTADPPLGRVRIDPAAGPEVAVVDHLVWPRIQEDLPAAASDDSRLPSPRPQKGQSCHLASEDSVGQLGELNSV